jgi:hypothetical protein
MHIRHSDIQRKKGEEEAKRVRDDISRRFTSLIDMEIEEHSLV